MLLALLGGETGRKRLTGLFVPVILGGLLERLAENAHEAAKEGLYKASARQELAEQIADAPRNAGGPEITPRERCECGKKLTNDTSKVYGIGPECRKGLPADVLANYYRLDVSRAHAAQ